MILYKIVLFYVIFIVIDWKLNDVFGEYVLFCYNVFLIWCGSMSNNKNMVYVLKFVMFRNDEKRNRNFKERVYVKLYYVVWLFFIFVGNKFVKVLELNFSWC